jgi:phage FluMu protein Com
MPSITCTHCGAVLKTKDPVPPGKKVKCPKCAQAFTVPEDEETEGAEPEEEAAAEEEEMPAKKGKAAAAEDGEEGEGEEGEGEEKSKKGGKGGDGKKNNKMIIGIVVAAVLLFCCCPLSCGTVYSIFGAAIQTALGIGAANQQNKAIEDMFKNIDKKK